MPVTVNLSVGPGKYTVYVYSEQQGDVPYYLHVSSQITGGSEIVSTAKKYYLKDHLGSTRRVVDASGSLLESYDYYPFGLVRSSSVSGEGTKQTFTGKEKDDETGFYYFGSRYYNPALAGWMATDPAGQFHSPYSYGGNPVMFVDPDGEFVFSALIPGVGIFIDAALWGAVINGGIYTATTAFQPGGLSNWNLGDFGKSAAVGAISGVASAGTGMLIESVMQNVYGAITGAFVEGSLSAVSGGLSGGFGNVIMEGDWAAFGDGVKQGALSGGIQGAWGGGKKGFLNAKNATFDRNLLFGGFTQQGREEAFRSLILKYELYQSGMINYSFNSLDNKYAKTVPISPVTGDAMSMPSSAATFENVNSEIVFDSSRRIKYSKIEELVIHEKQHVIDYRSGKVYRVFQNSLDKNIQHVLAVLEIRAHQRSLRQGFYVKFNKARISFWEQHLK